MPVCWKLAVLAWSMTAAQSMEIGERDVSTQEKASFAVSDFISQDTSPHQPSEAGRQPLKLSARRSARGQIVQQPKTRSPAGNLLTAGSSLAIVLGLLVLFIWIARRSMPKAAGLLPSEIVEVLGRAPLAGRQQMQLVRVGSKLILLALTPSGAETLTEISDPDEVNRLMAISQRDRPGSITQTFRHVLGQLGTQPTPSGFLGDAQRSDLEIANTGVAGSRSMSLEDTDA